MKGIILLLSLCFTVSVYAGNERYAQKHTSIDKVTLGRKIQKPESPISLAHKINSSSSNSSKVKALSKVGEKKSERKDVTKGWLDFGNVKTYSSQNANTKERLDSIIMTNSANEFVTLQKFFFDEHQWTTGRVNSLWNAKKRIWEPFEDFRFIWDEDGYLLTQTGINVVYNEGVKEEFTYNDKKLGISKTISNLIDGKWYFTEKGEYKYDDNGNIIEEIVCVYNEDKKTWENQSKAYATYSNTHKPTSYEGYSWNGNDWEGVDKCTYAYDAKDSIILFGFYEWQPETKNWLYFHKFEQEFKDGKIMMQLESFWNKTDKTWLGLEEYNDAILYTGKTDYIYDELGRATYEIYTRYEEDGWKKKVDLEGTWSTLETGQQQLSRKTYFYSEDNNTDKHITGELIQKYNSFGTIEYALEKFIKGDLDLYIYEEVYEYDKDGCLLGSTYWWFDEDNMKMADISEEYILDTNHNIIDSYYKQGQGTGENDWINVSRFTYDYEDNVRIEKLCYLWDDKEKAFLSSWGSGVKFDLSIHSKEMITPIGYSDDYKILDTYTYTGIDGEWDTQTYTYCYSVQNVTSIANQTDNTIISIYPNPVVDILYINSKDNAEVNMYNLQGARLLNTNEKKIDMSGYPAGLYIIEVNGVKTKVLKK